MCFPFLGEGVYFRGKLLDFFLDGFRFLSVRVDVGVRHLRFLGGFLLAIVMTPIAYFTVKRLVVRGRAFRLMLAKRKAAKSAAHSGASAQ